MSTTTADDRGRRSAHARRALQLALLGVAFGLLTLHTVPALSGELAVTVHAPGGALVPGVAIVLEPSAVSTAQRHRDKATARIEQRARHFVPQLLVVQKGTLVEFPNNDTVSHQVYSFSPARTFQLSLYKGTAHPPIEFDKAGLVVLGCNIHDDMVGYILVTESPYFAQTDAQGSGRLGGVAAGRYTLRVWSPRIADAPASLQRTVEVGESGEVAVDVVLSKALLAAPSPRPERSEWDAY